MNRHTLHDLPQALNRHRLQPLETELKSKLALAKKMEEIKEIQPEQILPNLPEEKKGDIPDGNALFSTENNLPNPEQTNPSLIDNTKLTSDAIQPQTTDMEVHHHTHAGHLKKQS